MFFKKRNNGRLCKKGDRMHPIRLKSKVTIEGSNLLGLKGKLTFYPSDLRDGWGWMWWKKSLPLSIDPSIVDTKARRTRLYFEGRKLQVYEHIGVLRWFGLCEVSIESTQWPPYHGRSIELWQAIKPFCEEDRSRDINWYTIRKPVKWIYPKLRNNQTAFTEISPNTKKELNIRIMCSYPGLEVCEISFTFPNRKRLEQICSVYNQGWPPILYHVLKLPSIFGWPHHKKILWPQHYSKARAAMEFTYRRAADLLGALSLLCRDGLLSADVTSICSGQKADIKAIFQAHELLYRLK